MDNTYSETLKITDYDSVYDLFCSTSSRLGETTAIQYLGSGMSFKKLKSEVDTMADYLLASGIHEGSVISIVSPMIPSVIIMFFAANKIGAICSIIDYNTTSSQLNLLLQEAKSDVLLILNHYSGQLEKVLENTNVKLIITNAANDYLFFSDKVSLLLYRLKNYYFESIDVLEIDSTDIKLVEWNEIFDAELTNSGEGSCSRSNTNNALYLHHSSLLDQKGVEVFSNKAILASCYSVINDYKLERFAINSRSAISFMNYAYNGAFVFAFLSMLCSGITLLIVPFNDDVKILTRALLKFKPGIIMGYPSIFTSIVETLSKTKYIHKDLSFIRLMIATGSSFVTTKRKYCEDFLVKHGCHIKISVCYGLTECLSTGSYVPRRVDRNNSIGIPFTGVVMKIFDTNTLRELQPGEKGEICICSEGVLSEVLGDEVKSSRIIKRHRDGRVWIHTGDIGHTDEEGYFYFDYVEKRCANIDGISVSLKKIEDVIKTVYGVFDVCVVDYVDEEGKTCIVAQVVPIESFMVDNDLLNRLIDNIEIECEMMLSSNSRPSEIEYRAYIPRIGSEVDYKTITREVIEKHTS